MSGADFGRQILRGVLDTLFLATLMMLVAANTGFLPVEGTQKSASAGFGVCSLVSCPWACSVWSVSPSPNLPYYEWTEDYCEVSAPETQWAGYCDGICGICPLGSRCSGSTMTTLVPCMCVDQGC